MKITIIGSGKVGSSVALNACLRDLGDVLLLDIVKGLPQGEAMDINHNLSELGIDSKVHGSNNYEDMEDSDIVVIVAGIGRKPGMTRMDLLRTNASIAKDVCSNIKLYSLDSKFIVVTNPLDPLTYYTLKVLGVDKRKVMGMGGMLDLSRFKEFISQIVSVSRRSIDSMVISEHGENMLPLIRFSSISGIPLGRFITDEQEQYLIKSTKDVAAEVIALKGATVYAPGNAVSSMLESIVKDKRTVMPASVLLEGEYGYNDVCIGVPSILGRNGIEGIVELNLNSKEKEIFDKGIKSVKEAIKELDLM